MALPVILATAGAHRERRQASVLKKMPPPKAKRAKRAKNT